MIVYIYDIHKGEHMTQALRTNVNRVIFLVYFQSLLTVKIYINGCFVILHSLRVERSQGCQEKESESSSNM